jgi:transcriptional regulator with XRE-family HTH domain
MKRGERKKAASPLWNKVIADITDDARYTVNLSNDIVDQIHLYLKQKNWSQKDLADALEKSPSEISKWLQPGHNFTTRTIGKLSAVLGKDLVATPLRYDSMHGSLLPFGSERSAKYRSHVDLMTGTTDVLTQPNIMVDVPDFNLNLNQNWMDTISKTTINLEGFTEPTTDVTPGTPSFAMAA